MEHLVKQLLTGRCLQLTDHVTSCVREASPKSQNLLEFVRFDKPNRVCGRRGRGGLPWNRSSRAEPSFVVCQPDCNVRCSLWSSRRRRNARRNRKLCAVGRESRYAC